SLYLAGTEGRLMRSLKSLLGSALMQESTEVYDGPTSFQDIVARFLHELARRAGRELGRLPEHVVIGRPVHFVDDDPARDQRAEDGLRRAARDAGFRHVAFQLEPIAAAFDHEQRIAREAVLLVADIGGGTSDFTVVRVGPQRMTRIERDDDVLATSGVHLGGTDFDQRLNLECVMPALGHRHRGPDGREVPSRVFFELSTWHLIQWAQTAKAVRQAQQLRGNYADAQLHRRLMTVLEAQYGHRIASLVEAAKIDASTHDRPSGIDLAFVEPALLRPLSPEVLREQLAAPLEAVIACAHECVRRAGLRSSELDAIYLTGGSSALRPFREALRRAFVGVDQLEGDLFGGVAAGLACAARARLTARTP
ncbi:MAG: Hsp70 family protein, partial [Comamonadaceae bacterium]